MANTYVKAAFAISMSQSDASIIRDAEAACDAIQTACENSDLAPAYARLGFPFRVVFPAREGDPFGAFFEIFDDPAYPTLDCDIEYGVPDAMGRCLVTFSGDQFGVEQIAMLLFTACKSALPCAFEYAYDCDSLRLGEFGGGAAVITTYGVTHCATARLIHDALSAATTEPDEGDDGFVLAHRDTEHGLSFWNDASGYGRLALARVFTEEEAGAFVLPVQGDHTEWLALPRRLA